MEPFETVSGVAAPLLIDSIDTDVITPMPRVLQGGDHLVRYAFEPLRYLADGSLDPDFVLNQRRYEDAKILIAGANFACGSSRETAVWAIKGLGFDVVIASSFGEIFHQNAFKSGLLPIQLSGEAVKSLANQADGSDFSIDLATQQIFAPDGSITHFDVNGFRKQGLLSGLEDLDLILTKADEIKAFEDRDRTIRPWAYL